MEGEEREGQEKKEGRAGVKIADCNGGQRGKFPRTGRSESVEEERRTGEGIIWKGGSAGGEGHTILVPVASALRVRARSQRVRDKTQLSAAKVPTFRQTLNKKDFPGKVN